MPPKKLATLPPKINGNRKIEIKLITKQIKALDLIDDMQSNIQKKMKLAVAILISQNERIVLKYDAKTLGQLLSTATLIEFNTNLVRKSFAAVLEQITNRRNYAAKKRV
jgi:hypothetical protein